MNVNHFHTSTYTITTIRAIFCIRHRNGFRRDLSTPFQRAQDHAERLWQSGLNSDFRAGWQPKDQPEGVKHEPRKFFLDFPGAIEGIPSDWVAHAEQMDANLVPPTRMGACLDQCMVAETLPDEEVGHAALSPLTIDGDAAGAELSQGPVDHAPIFGYYAVGQGQVLFAHRPCLELLIEPAMGLGVPRKDDHAAGFLVEAMHDVKPLIPVGAERFKQRRRFRTPFRDRSQTFRLVDSYDVVILKQNLDHGIRDFLPIFVQLPMGDIGFSFPPRQPQAPAQYTEV